MSSLHEPALDPATYAVTDDIIRNGTFWASTPTLDPWTPAILTLDGGGIRGYSSLLILSTLMSQISTWERKLSPDAEPSTFDEANLLPCHYFDYMYGTSTGGLIATMLGRLRMSVPQALAVYRTVGQNLFGQRRSLLPLTTKYSAAPLEDAVRDIVRTHCKQHLGECDGNDWYPWADEIHNAPADVDFNANICQSICLTAVHNGRIDEAHMLRTYDHRYEDVPNWILPYNEGADRLKIWQVTRATSAAPFYFKMLEADLRGEKWVFKDGGIRENNPAGAAWSEFTTLLGEGRDPSLLLSIGTGRPDEQQDGFATAWPGPFGKSSLVRRAAEKFAVIRNVLIKYTAGEEKHRALLATARGQHTWYKRLNVTTGLEGLPLDEWRRGRWRDPATGIETRVPGGRTLSRMERATRAYLERDIDIRFDTYARPAVVVAQVAEKLVRQRRAREATREENPVRWDTYVGRYLTGRYAEPDGPVEWDVEAGKRRGSHASLASIISRRSR